MKKSKNFMAGLCLFLVMSILTSCGGDKEKKKENELGKLGKMELVIPDELKDNQEMVKYIEGMTEVVDEYAIVLDELIPKMAPFQGKDFEDLKLGQQIKFTALIGEAGLKSAPIMVKWADFEMNRSIYDEELTEDELMALETVWTHFEDRMMQIEERHSKFFSEDSEE